MRRKAANTDLPVNVYRQGKRYRWIGHAAGVRITSPTFETVEAAVAWGAATAKPSDGTCENCRRIRPLARAAAAAVRELSVHLDPGWWEKHFNGVAKS